MTGSESSVLLMLKLQNLSFSIEGKPIFEGIIVREPVARYQALLLRLATLARLQ